MHPAPSIILFTVASGLGFGLMACSTLWGLLDAGAGASPGVQLWAGSVALLLTCLGLCASTFHLANPRNAWRAFSRFRTSWLSREAILAVVFYPFAIAYLVLVWKQGPALSRLGALLGAVTVLLALATVFSTGMIYACLRTIRQWNTPLVPMNFILLSLAGGAALLTLIHALTDVPALRTSAIATLALLATAALGKLIYYFWIGKPQGATINTAIGMTRARVKLLDLGQSSASFLDKEFGYQPLARRITGLRLLVYGLGFILPALFLVLMMRAEVPWLALPMLLSLIAGLAVERWLFFAEARHVVNLFFGQQRA